VKPGVFVGDKDASGFPDLVLVRAPDVLFVELKRELGKVSDGQQEWLDDLIAAGCEVHVVRPSDEREFARRLTRGRFIQV